MNLYRVRRAGAVVSMPASNHGKKRPTAARNIAPAAVEFDTKAPAAHRAAGFLLPYR
jgi:hypothetical protein